MLVLMIDAINWLMKPYGWRSAASVPSALSGTYRALILNAAGFPLLSPARKPEPNKSCVWFWPLDC